MMKAVSLAPSRSDSGGHGFSRAASRIPSVTAELAYLAPTTVRPFNYMYDPPPGVARQNCKYQLTPVRIADARSTALPPDIQVEGFELWNAPTSIVDFRDEEAIRGRYYAEAAELAKCVTGAPQAYVFDHQIRRREAGRPPLSFGRDGGSDIPGAAGRVHNDYSEASGRKRLELVLQDPAVRSRLRRFAVVNIWRSIAGKIHDTPLAICDARTVSINDLAATDLLYPGRTGEIYLVHRSPSHRWFYFSEMDRDEALVFKQYDSQVNGVARLTPHSAFDLPDIVPDAPLRESIEIRCLVTYE